MTVQNQNLLDKESAYIGPVIAASRALIEAMQPMPLCAACPAAQWYRTEDSKGAVYLAAFCTTFRAVMYDKNQYAVTTCDGRADAIGDLMQRSS